MRTPLRIWIAGLAATLVQPLTRAIARPRDRATRAGGLHFAPPGRASSHALSFDPGLGQSGVTFIIH